MAIINGPYASKMRGKVGEVVAAKTTGNRTALRSYQPNVKNPNTARQRAARAIFSALSAAVASLSELLQIGYAKAANGTKMYPRNLAMQDYRKDTAAFTFGTNGIESVDYASLKLSRAVGMTAIPALELVKGTGGNPSTITFSNYADFNLNPAEYQVGVVVAFIPDNSTEIANPLGVIKKAASAVITLDGVDLDQYIGCHVIAFVKAIPLSGTPIPTTEWPWKYPADTSVSVYLGTVQQ